MVNVEHPFIVITPKSTLTRSESTDLVEVDLFENYSHSIGTQLRIH